MAKRTDTQLSHPAGTCQSGAWEGKRMRSRSSLGFAFAALIGVSVPVIAQSPSSSQRPPVDQRNGTKSADPATDSPTVRLIEGQSLTKSEADVGTPAPGECFDFVSDNL